MASFIWKAAVVLLVVGILTVPGVESWYGDDEDSSSQSSEARYVVKVFSKSASGVVFQQYGSPDAESGFQPVDSSNKREGDVSHIIAFHERCDSNKCPGRFNKEIYICRIKDFSGTKHHILSETECTSRRFQKVYGAARSISSFFVATQRPDGADHLYTATCKTRDGDFYNRLGDREDLCGHDRTQSSIGFYAIKGEMLCPVIPKLPEHMSITNYQTGRYGYRHTSMAVTCETGYNIQGANNVFCKPSGVWGDFPRCEPISCRRPRVGVDVKVEGNRFEYNSYVTLSCAQGYELTPEHLASLKCNYDGEWNPNPAGAKCNRVQCTPLDNLNHGKITGDRSYQYEDTLTFSCDDGYRLEGANSTTCRGDKRWSHPLPTCERIKCPALSHPQNGRRENSNFGTGNEIVFVCDDGYKLEGKAVLTCVKDGDQGNWDEDKPTCNRIICPTVDPPDNGVLQGSDYSYGQNVKITCNRGYRVQGSDIITCIGDGVWDDKPAKCIAKLCRDPGVPEHGQRDKEVFKYGSVLTYTCDTGFHLTGPSSIVCTSEATWSHPRPNCAAMVCNSLEAPDNGKKDKEDLEYSGVTSFSCFPGYTLVGQKSTTCGPNGQWDLTIMPTCQPCPVNTYKDDSRQDNCQPCPNNSYTVTVASNSKMQCMCKQGTDGQPGGPCTVVECPVLTAPENGEVSSCGNTKGEECHFVCKPGYIIEGARSVRCTADGWTGSPQSTKCAPCPENTYKMSEGAHTCTPCPHYTRTAGTGGNSIRSCECMPGYEGSAGGPCKDVNECATDNGGCNHDCANTPGSYHCLCNIAGYTLQADGKTCNRTEQCPEIEQAPANGNLSCRYRERQNAEMCYVRCNKGYYFVSGQNNYVTCGEDTDFKWSHRVVNDTARIPACTRQFYTDVGMPFVMKYNVTSCNGQPEFDSQIPINLNAAVNSIQQCTINKCEVDEVVTRCRTTATDNEAGNEEVPGVLEVRFSITVYNEIEDQVAIDCDPSCQRQYLFAVLKAAQAVKITFGELVKDESEILTSPLGSGLNVVPNSLKPGGRTSIICKKPGFVYAKNRLCTPCDRGFYLPDPKDNVCQPCPKGKYQDETAQTSCKSCLPTTTTLDVGSDHAAMCSIKVVESFTPGKSDQPTRRDADEEERIARMVEEYFE